MEVRVGSGPDLPSASVRVVGRLVVEGDQRMAGRRWPSTPRQGPDLAVDGTARDLLPAGWRRSTGGFTDTQGRRPAAWSAAISLPTPLQLPHCLNVRCTVVVGARPPCPWRHRCSAHDMPEQELAGTVARPTAPSSCCRSAAGDVVVGGVVGVGCRRAWARRRRGRTTGRLGVGFGRSPGRPAATSASLGDGRVRLPACCSCRSLQRGDAAGRRTSPSRPSSPLPKLA